VKRLSVLLFFLTLGFTCSLTAAAQQVTAPDTTEYTTTEIRLRVEPTPTARILATLVAGTRVRLNHCSDGWCSVTARGRTGYLLEEFLTNKTPKPPAVNKGYNNSQGVRVPSPQRTLDNQPPQGATALCRDGSYSFSHSRRGTCSHHGGVAQWL
jgi:uncharacterized protein YgiM (DUF1202 family)